MLLLYNANLSSLIETRLGEYRIPEYKKTRKEKTEFNSKAIIVYRFKFDVLDFSWRKENGFIVIKIYQKNVSLIQNL